MIKAKKRIQKAGLFARKAGRKTIKLYIAGWDEESRGYLSLSLNNKSDWMVRARREVSVEVMFGLGFT